jgi:putative SbcD/Mre11-related phosphoesterase
MKKSKDSSKSIAHPIPDEPAYILEDRGTGMGNALIIADIHFGIEHALAEIGVHVPSQTESIFQHILNLCSEYNAKHLIILGDIKHTIPGTSKQEWYELPEVFGKLNEVLECINIIPGNHDGGLKNIFKKYDFNIKLHPNNGCVLFGVGLFHGHTWPDKSVFDSDQVIFAHNHPHILFVDKLGGRASFPCWVRTKLNFNNARKRYPKLEKNGPEIIIIPAFTDIGSGTPVNTPKPEFLGPVLKNKMIDMKNARIYLLDGTLLGKLKDLIETNNVKFYKDFKYHKYLKLNDKP